MAVTVEMQDAAMSNRRKASTAACGSTAAVRVDKVLRGIVSFLLLIFPTATLFLNRGDSYVLGILTLIGIGVWLRGSARRWLDRQSALLWIAFVLFFAVALLSYLLGVQTDAGFRFLGRYLRFLLIVPAYLALRYYLPTAKTVFVGLAAGALFAGLFGGLHYLHADRVIRIEATTGLSIIFGDLATTMTLCTVAGLGLLTLSHRRWAAPLLVLCIAGGVAASLFSGTRGAWVPFLFIPVVLIYGPLGAFKLRYIGVVAIVILAIFSSCYFILGNTSRTRISDVFYNVQAYFIGSHAFENDWSVDQVGMRCMDRRSFLEAWLRWYTFAAPEMRAQVKRSSALVSAKDCHNRYAIELQNTDDLKIHNYGFPRYPSDSARGRMATLLVKGEGSLVIYGSGGKEVHFDSKRFAGIRLVTGDVRAATEIAVYVPPKHTVWLVPVSSYPGEFSLPIMDTSVGQRLEMWRAAWKIFIRHPVLGVGTGAYQTSTQQLIHANVIASFVGRYDHPHNDYLNALASSGIVGFLALLGVLLLPAWYFQRAVHSSDKTIHALGLAGLLTIASFGIYALTDTIFLHSMMITWYVIYMATFYALIKARADKQKTGAY